MYFPGKDRLVAALDAAVASGSDAVCTDAVRAALVALFADREVRLPPAVLTPCADHYARRQLHVSDTHGYSVIAMTWGPGQGTHVHDHDGAWCVEGVWHGRLAITQYTPVGHDGGRWRFDTVGETAEAGPGSAGSLIPPHEYHTVQNPSEDAVAVSIHVYQRPLLRCHVFVPDAADPSWTRREERLLADDP